MNQSDTRWCSNSQEFKCSNGGVISMTFMMDCCDREVISFVARRGKGLSSWMAQEQSVLVVCKRFGALDAVPQSLPTVPHTTKHLLKMLGIQNC